MDRLLAEDGCPWDREQTLETLRPYLLEETYEVLEAMDDSRSHRDELGDLLFQIVFASALREREGSFDLDEVIAGIRDKLIRRHPHVFDRKPGAPAPTRQQVAQQWEAIKRAERTEAGTEAEAPAAAFERLQGISGRLPALVRAMRLQYEASELGFDWPELQGALDKFSEEWDEFTEARHTGSRSELEDEYGDLLFVLVRIGQKLGLDAEVALRRANAKFERRFGHVLRRCEESGLEPTAAGLDRLDGFWQEAKRGEGSIAREDAAADPQPDPETPPRR
jgi:MazG family protein